MFVEPRFNNTPPFILLSWIVLLSSHLTSSQPFWVFHSHDELLICHQSHEKYLKMCIAVKNLPEYAELCITATNDSFTMWRNVSKFSPFHSSSFFFIKGQPYYKFLLAISSPPGRSSQSHISSSFRQGSLQYHWYFILVQTSVYASLAFHAYTFSSSSEGRLALIKLALEFPSSYCWSGLSEASAIIDIPFNTPWLFTPSQRNF